MSEQQLRSVQKPTCSGGQKRRKLERDNQTTSSLLFYRAVEWFDSESDSGLMTACPSESLKEAHREVPRDLEEEILIVSEGVDHTQKSW